MGLLCLDSSSLFHMMLDCVLDDDVLRGSAMGSVTGHRMATLMISKGNEHEATIHLSHNNSTPVFSRLLDDNSFTWC
jgi:hypothetical protein